MKAWSPRRIGWSWVVMVFAGLRCSSSAQPSPVGNGGSRPSGVDAAGSPAAQGGFAGGVDAGAPGSGGQAGWDSGTGGSCSWPGTICWDFEEGVLPAGWTPYRNEYGGQLVVDATRPHQGRYALHAKDLVGGAEGVQGGPKKTIRFDLPADFGSTLWGRAYIYTSPARPVSHAGLFNARYPRPGSTATTIDKLDWYEVATYTHNYMTVWHPPEPPGYPEWVQVSDAPLILDNWACLEWLFDAANGDQPQAADPRMWLDGAELTWPMSFVFSDPATTIRPFQEKAANFTVLETGTYLYQGLPVATNWWIDDLAIGQRRIGCN